mmetsp:Transcript_14768/g.29512  ORF Transcript_14768/g.29512 Transcript_14768/m.29512 type:complete len:156 (+) Transcript_14768:94-561(+)
MRKRLSGRKLGRPSAHRWAMLRNMVSSLFEHGRIVTTTPKAKEVRKVADQCITLGKKGTLDARRRAANIVRTPALVQHLFDVLSPRYIDRPGGYTRVLAIAKRRQGDAAHTSVVELVDREGELRPARPPPGRTTMSAAYIGIEEADLLTDGVEKR